MPPVVKTILKIIWKGIATLLLLFIFAISLFYINTTIYDFPEITTFKGDFIYNPYANLPDSVYRANFHAHSIAWDKVTNGHNTEKDLFDAYTERGYDVPGISNYHNISEYGKTRCDLYIPEYEHGYNMFKSHYLSINPDEVSYFDYPVFQLTSHQQKVIEKLREKNALIAMAHPKFGGGRSFEDMQYLVDYDFTEVLNHYRVSDEYWDKALSAGRLTWVMGNDDTHDIVNEPTFLIWNMIYAKERTVESVLDGMKAGQNYAIKSLDGEAGNELISCATDSTNTISVAFKNPVPSLEFVGQDGVIKSTLKNVSSGAYTFDKEDTYIRIVARHGQSDLYLNPIVRYDGKDVPLNNKKKATANFFLTWLFRLGIAAFSISLLILIRKILRRK